MKKKLFDVKPVKMRTCNIIINGKKVEARVPESVYCE